MVLIVGVVGHPFIQIFFELILMFLGGDRREKLLHLVGSLAGSRGLTSGLQK